MIPTKLLRADVLPTPKRLGRRLGQWAETVRHSLPRPIGSIDAQESLATDAVDVEELIRSLSVEQLISTADEYYSKQRDGVDYWHAKPFWHTDEVVDMTITFGHVLGALRLARGMRVLDFGAGTGWTSRFLTQLGCEVIVSDVSSTALEMAEQLYERLPVIGDRPSPTFLKFNGHQIDLDDASVDRVLCFDALHHTPDPIEILAEMARVLKPGGRAAFSEPGPNHSKTAQSQFEMRNYAVIENDVFMRRIEKMCGELGFDDLSLLVFCTAPFQVSVDGYERLMAGRREALNYLEHHREFLSTRRVFVLRRAGSERSDSRGRHGLAGTISVELDAAARGATVLQGRYKVVNTGSSHWLPSNAPLGPVRIGVHLYDLDGALIDRDFARIDLASEVGMAPGEAEEGSLSLRCPPKGHHVLEFDLISEHVAWFEINGTKPARVTVHIE